MYPIEIGRAKILKLYTPHNSLLRPLVVGTILASWSALVRHSQLMKYLLVVLLLLPLTLSSQRSELRLSSTTIDFGTIKEGDDRIRELQLENLSADTVDILRMSLPTDEYTVRFSTKKIAPGTTAIVRLRYNPKSKGAFSDRLTLYTGPQSFEIKSKGKTDHLEWMDYTPCPDFGRPSAEGEGDFEVVFNVIDVKTREPIAGAEVTLQGKVSGEYRITTRRDGSATAEVPIDHYAISAKMKGYGKFEMASYINRRNKVFTLELLKGENSHTLVVRPGDFKKEQEATAETVVVEEQEETVDIMPAVEEAVVSPIQEDSDDFSIEEFKPNNVVFLIDVSTSMRKEERMELLKSSMVELTEMLRPDDRLSIVTYATTTEVLMSGRSIDDKEAVIAIIESLEAQGTTAGEAGIKRAYTLARRHYIEGGNNQVYLATDGAFSQGTESILKTVAKESDKGTHLSVLSIRGSKWTRPKMEGITDAAGGAYVLIDDEETAPELLRNLVRTQAQR